VGVVGAWFRLSSQLVLLLRGSGFQVNWSSCFDCLLVLSVFSAFPSKGLHSEPRPVCVGSVPHAQQGLSEWAVYRMLNKACLRGQCTSCSTRPVCLAVYGLLNKVLGHAGGGSQDCQGCLIAFFWPRLTCVLATRFGMRVHGAIV
jgi:hypothetical protein